MTTYITHGGVAYSVNAKNNQGPKINITYAKISDSFTPSPVPDDPSTDDTFNNVVYQASPGQLAYTVVDDHTVEYILTLDESVGPFNIARIGLYTDDGTLFSITMIDTKDAVTGAQIPDSKFPTAGSVVGNRLTYSIYLAISDVANIANFTIQLLQLLTIPEVPSELSLPPPTDVKFNTYQVDKHSFARTAAIGLRQTSSQGRPGAPAWLMSSERLIPGQGEGIVPVDPGLFDSTAIQGKIICVNNITNKYSLADPQITNLMVGIRSGNEEITNYGMYVDPTTNYNSALTLLYAGTGANAGQIVITPNNWCIGYTIGPVNSQPPGSQPITGWLCWIDFTGGLFARLSGGGATGATGATGPGGSGGGGGGPGGGFQFPGQCYLELSSSGLLYLRPYNGNSIVINGQLQTIPSSGINLPVTGLAANTNYYIYAYMTQTGMALQASTTGHITSTITGVEIKNLDQNYTLVGFARTVAGPAWSDTDGQMYVLSWFNRKRKRSRSKLTTDCSNNAGDWTEVSTQIRNYFLIWGNQAARFSLSGSHSGNQGDGVATCLEFDSTDPRFAENNEAANCNEGSRSGANAGSSLGISGSKIGLLEGDHYCTMMGCLTGGGPGRANWHTFQLTNDHPSSNPLLTPITITVTVDG